MQSSPAYPMHIIMLHYLLNTHCLNLLSDFLQPIVPSSSYLIIVTQHMYIKRYTIIALDHNW